MKSIKIYENRWKTTRRAENSIVGAACPLGCFQVLAKTIKIFGNRWKSINPIKISENLWKAYIRAKVSFGAAGCPLGCSQVKEHPWHQIREKPSKSRSMEICEIKQKTWWPHMENIHSSTDFYRGNRLPLRMLPGPRAPMTSDPRKNCQIS